MTGALAASVLSVGAGCGQGCNNSGPAPPGTPIVDAAATGRDASRELAHAHPASRCGECHGRLQEEWAASAHAKSAASQLYVAMRGRAGDNASCDRCHASLVGLIEAENPAAQEGVTCDVCHAIAEVDIGAEGSRFDLKLKDNVKYGPMCGIRDHYFHKMGCSPLHHESEICAACHHYSVPGDAGAIGVYTEYDEWKKSPYAPPHIECQDCHMPGELTEVAVGSAQRAEVPNHGFLGRDGQLRKRALALTLTVHEKDGQLSAAIAIENHGAGHHVPTGMPGRQVVLRVRALDEGGQEIERAERVYTRVLVDGRGDEVPFYEAKALKSDTRIAAKETRKEELQLGASEAAREVRAELTWRFSPALAEKLGATGPEESLAEARVGFGARRAKGGRAALPKTVTVKP